MKDSANLATNEVIRAEALPQGWSAQQAKLWPLIHMLQQAEGKWANIYTPSSYAFATLHIKGANYEKRGLLTVGNQKQKRYPSTVRGSPRCQSFSARATGEELTLSVGETDQRTKQLRRPPTN